MEWHSLSSSEAAKELAVSIENGLNDKEAIKRQRKYGANVLKSKKKKSVIIKFFEQFKDFMIITLICAAIVSFAVSWLNGELDFVDPAIILLIITMNALMGVIQETKAEKSLEALKKMSAPTAKVKRNKKILTVDSSELVPGDIILLEAGHYVPADARLIEAANLKVEESSLTGESHPVEKEADKILSSSALIGDRINMVMSTTIVTYGRGTAIVVNTGMNTEVGHIANLIMNDEAPATPLQKKLDKTSKALGMAALLICIIIFILGILKKRPVFDMFMTSVSLAVAAIPEGLPAIVTIMLSLGVQRMVKKNAVIRKLPAVETLGSATIICSDKTGTLTQNKMTVTDIYSLHGEERHGSTFRHFILMLGSLCNDSILQVNKKMIEATGEPTEKAIVLAANQEGIQKPKADLLNKRVYEIPFDSTRKLMTTVNKLESGKYRSITKGAPEVLVNKCTHCYENGTLVPFTEHKKRIFSHHNQAMANKALRVIAVAYKDLDTFTSDSNRALVKGQNLSSADSYKTNRSTNPASGKYLNESLESGLVYVGLIGMIDPPREEVKDAVLTCKMAGIKPVMITGDHVSTACAIAKDLGILNNGERAITGSELSEMSPDKLKANIYQYSVFARVSPEHKVRIVKAFQANGEVVAMTGDGVNDAPALKAADIGCAMGITGTDVAKNAADMILTDDNFATIVAAVKEGRGIYDNIKKSIHFLLSSNIGEIITIFTAILLGLPSPLLAVQLLWVNLVTDSLPAIALGMEKPEKDIMKKKPVPPNKGLFADGLVFRIIAEGIMIGALALSAFVIGIKFFDHTSSPEIGRTMAFAVLSLSQLFHSFNMRSEHSIFKIGLFSNPRLVMSFIICTFLQIIVISFPVLAVVFKVVPLNLMQWAIVFGLSFIPILIIELQKQSNSR